MQNFQAQRTLLQNSPPKRPVPISNEPQKICGRSRFDTRTPCRQNRRFAEQRESQEVFTPLWNDLRQTDENDLCVTNGDSVGNERRTFAGLVRVASDGRIDQAAFRGSDRQQPGDQKKHRNRRHFLFCGYLYTRPDMRSGTQGSETSLSVYDGSAIQRIRSDFRRDGRICYGFFTPERIALPGTSPYSRVRAADGFVRSDDRLRLATPGAELMTRSADSEQDETRYYCAYCNWQIVNGSCPNPNCKPVEVVACPVCHSQECVWLPGLQKLSVQM